MTEIKNQFGASAHWLVILCLWGCQQGARQLSLDESQAREACTMFLRAWQDNLQVESLKPEIIGRDYVWDEGSKLLSFELLPQEFNDGTNLHIPVRLKLQDAKGTASDSEVVYVVGTSPVVTVFRKD